jgi:hypothetical protein
LDSEADQDVNGSIIWSVFIFLRPFASQEDNSPKWWLCTLETRIHQIAKFNRWMSQTRCC